MQRRKGIWCGVCGGRGRGGRGGGGGEQLCSAYGNFHSEMRG